MKIIAPILILLVILISSCNPDDPSQPPNSGSSNLTVAQAVELIQGTWYLDRVEITSEPTCAGGAGEISNMFTSDLSFTGWKVQFTQNPVTSSLWQEYQFYSDGGDYTGGYSIVDGSDVLLSALGIQGSTGVYFMIPTSLMYLEDLIVGGGGGKIELLNQNEFRLDFSGVYGMFYFKRSNSSSVPANLSNLSGIFVHDNTTVVQSGNIVSNATIQNGHALEFTNEIVSDIQSKRLYYKCIETEVQNAPQVTTFLSNTLNTDYSFFCTSQSHLIGRQINGTFLPDFSYKICALDNTQLVLREHIDCNDYTEYHFTKVN